MEFKNKYVVAYDEDKVIVEQTEGSGEIFPANGLQVKMFDTEEERDSYIVSEGLAEELYD